MIVGLGVVEDRIGRALVDALASEQGRALAALGPPQAIGFDGKNVIVDRLGILLSVLGQTVQECSGACSTLAQQKVSQVCQIGWKAWPTCQSLFTTVNEPIRRRTRLAQQFAKKSPSLVIACVDAGNQVQHRNLFFERSIACSQPFVEPPQPIHDPALAPSEELDRYAADFGRAPGRQAMVQPLQRARDVRKGHTRPCTQIGHPAICDCAMKGSQV